MSQLAAWTSKRVADDCRAAYRAYHADVRQRHVQYFAQHPDLRGPTHDFGAASFEAALPPGWGSRLAALVPETSRHKHARSGGSSQTLAVGLLGPPALYDEHLQWLFEPKGVFPRLKEPLGWEFEYPVGFGLLNELPRTTDIDFFVCGADGVIAVEAKFTEQGMGTCSCKKRATGDCDERVKARPYWKVAREVFGLSGPNPPTPCQLSFAYQAVRNTAAVLEMTGLRKVAAFGILYDARNPYFAGVPGGWPGWAQVLRETRSEQVVFRAQSWQELIPLLPERGRQAVFEWAAQKHGLVATS